MGMEQAPEHTIVYHDVSARRVALMDVQARLAELMTLAQSVGLTIRRETLGGSGGGLCTLKGLRVLFVDTSADPETQYERTLAALAPLEQVQKHYLPPEVREDLEKQLQG
jgi:hypothetical protein